MILIFCDGGFANRVNSMVSGMAVAALLKRDYVVLWPDNNRCGVRLDEVFVPHCVAMPTRLQDLSPYGERLRCWMHEDDIGFPNHFLGLRGLSGPEGLEALAGDDRTTILFVENAILPWLPQELVAATLRRLTFRPEIVAAALRVLGGRAPDTFFGVHMRGTDFLPPPPIEQMLGVVTQSPQYGFFVCSDDPKLEELFGRQPNVFTHRKTTYVDKLTADGPWRHDVVDSDGLPYTSNINRTGQSVIEACVDLLVLGMSVPLRSSASSFFALAERLREAGVIAAHLQALAAAGGGEAPAP